MNELQLKITVSDDDYAYLNKIAALMSMQSGKMVKADDAYQFLLQTYIDLDGVDLVTDMMKAISDASSKEED